jgi:5-methylcytosine-specific restriction enzyme A
MYDRHSAAVIRSKRWKGLRYQAKRRDGWQCVQCGAKGRLEVDHIKPVRTNPELAYDLNNLQTLCVSCHTRKTRIECGHPEKSPERKEWDALLKRKVP